MYFWMGIHKYAGVQVNMGGYVGMKKVRMYGYVESVWNSVEWMAMNEWLYMYD